MNRSKVFYCAIILLLLFYCGCSKTDSNSLAPYEGATDLSLTAEQTSFRPQITWVGGYVSILGINRGNKAALDTSLVWLIYAPSNSMKYPVTFGKLPSGAQDLTTSYGGKTPDSLSEDKPYTFWIMKESIWNQISATAKDKTLLIDSTLSNSIKVSGDTIRISPLSLSRKAQTTDVFVNIKDVSSYGKFADISIIAPVNTPQITVKWKIIQTNVQDTAIAAMGITEGTQYNPTAVSWEIYSLDSLGGKEVYGASDIIAPPVKIGQKIQGTKVFTEFPSSGLARNRDYYLWIANKSWDQTTRFRGTDYYSYATFHVY